MTVPKVLVGVCAAWAFWTISAWSFDYPKEGKYVCVARYATGLLGNDFLRPKNKLGLQKFFITLKKIDREQKVLNGCFDLDTIKRLKLYEPPPTWNPATPDEGFYSMMEADRKIQDCRPNICDPVTYLANCLSNYRAEIETKGASTVYSIDGDTYFNNDGVMLYFVGGGFDLDDNYGFLGAHLLPPVYVSS